MTKIAVLASYNGSGFKAIYEASQRKEINLEIVLLISNNSNATALQSACEFGIKTALVNAKTDENPDKKIEQLLHVCGCEYVFLSGYMKKLSSNITNHFKIINSHPSLLPKYGGAGMYGRFVHEAVVKNREEYSGVTIHEVDENYDEGKVILQKKIKLAENETASTLEEKIKKIEQAAIVEVFKNIS